MHATCETLEVAMANLEKATLVVAMESKVSMAVIPIWSKIDIAHCELERDELLDPKCRIQLEMEISVLIMNLDLLGLKHVPSNNVSDL